MRILPASDAAVIVIFGEKIAREYHSQVVQLFRRVRALEDPRIRNLHPAYASLLVEFDPLRMSHEDAAQLLSGLMAEHEESAFSEQRTIEIPVCYDREFAPDLSAVAAHAKLSADQVIAAHSSAEYFVYFLGFSPGFAYLGGLPSALATPRLATPRKSVAAGSVGIAGNQTGVYPVESPGGWQLIGRTPLRVFDAESQPPTLLQPGDSVRFRPITRAEFDRLHAVPGSRA